MARRSAKNVKNRQKLNRRNVKQKPKIVKPINDDLSDSEPDFLGSSGEDNENISSLSDEGETQDIGEDSIYADNVSDISQDEDVILAENVDQDELATHKKELYSLKQTDHKFYKFLIENDRALLDFGEDELDCDSSPEDPGLAPEEIFKRILDFALAQHTPSSLRTLIQSFTCAVKTQFLDEDGSTNIGQVKKRRMDDGIPKKSLKNDGKTRRGSIKIHDSEFRNKIIFETLNNFADLVEKICETDKVIAHRLELSEVSDADIPVRMYNWSRVHVIINVFWREVQHLLTRSTPEIISKILLLLTSNSRLLKWLLPFEKRSHIILKTAIIIWSSNPSHEIRVFAFTFIRNYSLLRSIPTMNSLAIEPFYNDNKPKTLEDEDIQDFDVFEENKISLKKKPFYDRCVTRKYKGRKNAKVMDKFCYDRIAEIVNLCFKVFTKKIYQCRQKGYTRQIADTFKFMENCIVELLSSNDDVAYQMTVTWVEKLRQMLRSVQKTKKRSNAKTGKENAKSQKIGLESEKRLFSWGFIISCRLLCSSFIRFPFLRPLAFPLSNVITTTLKLKLSDFSYIPFSLHVISVINNMSEAIDRFIPLGAYIVYLSYTAVAHFESSHQKVGIMPGDRNKPLDMNLTLKLEAEQESSRVVMLTLSNKLASVALDILGLLSKHPSFPEVSHPLLFHLKKLSSSKNMNVGVFRKQIQNILRVSEESSKIIREKRNNLDPKKKPNPMFVYFADTDIPLARLRKQTIQQESV